jgi:FimV-like protein
MLVRQNLADEAQRQLEIVLRSDPRHVKALALLENLRSARANLDLGAALLRSGQTEAARPYLERAANSGDAGIRAEARKLLETLR